MTISMVFKGDVTTIRNDFNTLYNSILYDQVVAMNYSMVDPYTFQPKGAVVTSTENLGMVKELTKRKVHCLITVACEDEEYTLTLYSSNLESPVEIERSFRECRLEDPVKQLIESHATGTILVEQSTKQALPEDQILTDEHIRLLQLAREEVHYARGKSLVKKVYPGLDPTFSSKQGLKKFCTRMINQDAKLKEKVEADGIGN